MKRIQNYTVQRIHLEGFGFIEIEENVGDGWKIDLFPRGSENDEGSLLLESNFAANGDKYFQHISGIRKKTTTP